MTTAKFEKLLSILKEMQSVVLAFSGGVDSTFLLKAVRESGIRHLAVTAFSETMPGSELKCAEETARLMGVHHRIIRTGELDNPEFSRNPRNRCFYCKDELFSKLSDIAAAEGYKCVIDGSNNDDLADWRPGRQAAVKHGVRSPLMEAALSKDEIREISKAMGLPTWSKPASPCLSSRLPYGTEITRDALKRIELSEEFLKSLGFGNLRVRSHDDMARIEVTDKELSRFFDKGIRESVVTRLREFGFKYIVVDLEGFRSGRLNE
ncbi:MAG: ATP-dependent sacrificial sulfur transferase LarE [Nitrospirae bacterium]|nr:ATP-dependent sacrificial sulfur transferase LarE [Nitrospirota bacterium]MCL5237936.1 ATP-dependent sacrificial sulfur transferase LarE [Nitrospirota bacterium]